ncbi:MAG: rhomboid family intramembrane serine protease [Chloroflexi bacterium]|nr:rhomboid family intramembrane serine protease [Chloroflexota bacterium]
MRYHVLPVRESTNGWHGWKSRLKSTINLLPGIKNKMPYRRYASTPATSLWALIGTNIIVYIATSLFNWLAVYFAINPLTFTSEPWTLITSMFVHAGFFHLLFNMLTLYFFGTYVILLLGERWFLFIYFLGGIAGGLLYVLLGPNFSAVGASGAIFAIAGALAVIQPNLRVIIFPIPVPIPLWVDIIILMALSFLSYYVAWQAHLGGLLIGIIVGFLLKKRTRHLLL